MATTPACHIENLTPRARHLIQTLNLQYLPHESGYIGLLGTSSQTITTSSGKALAAQSHNYYMLTSSLPINYLHWLEPDDTHILIEGGPVEYYVFHAPSTAAAAKAEKRVLGRDFANGHTAIVSVPGGCWKALRLLPEEEGGAGYALVGNVLSPEFTGERVRIARRDWDEEEKEMWMGMFEGGAGWASRDRLEGLVGMEGGEKVGRKEMVNEGFGRN